MPYVNVNNAQALAGALCQGGPVNRKRDGSKAAELSVVNHGPTGFGDLGLMNVPAERDSVRGAVRVVYSFLTPIAWELGDGRWVVSLQHYGVRTTRHQRVIAQAITEAFDAKRGPLTVDGRNGLAVLTGKPDTWILPAAA